MTFKIYSSDWDKETRKSTYYTNPSKTEGIIIDGTDFATDLNGKPYTGPFEKETSPSVMWSGEADTIIEKGYYNNGHKSGSWDHSVTYSNGRTHSNPVRTSTTSYSNGRKLNTRFTCDEEITYKSGAKPRKESMISKIADSLKKILGR